MHINSVLKHDSFFPNKHRCYLMGTSDKVLKSVNVVVVHINIPEGVLFLLNSIRE